MLFPCSLTALSSVTPADAQMLVLFQENAEKEALYKAKWSSPAHASKLYYLRGEEICGLKPLMDRMEELALAAVRTYIRECKSEKTFKVWPGVADDLVASHRDAFGNWITVADGTGKWEKEPGTVYTSQSPLATQPLTPQVRGARKPASLPKTPKVRGAHKRVIVTKSPLGKRKQSISDDTPSDPSSESDSDPDKDFVPRKGPKPESRQGRTSQRKRREVAVHHKGKGAR